MPSGDQEDGQYPGPNNTLAQLNQEQGSTAIHGIIAPFYSTDLLTPNLMGKCTLEGTEM